MKKLILCDLDTEENDWDYKCPKLSSDDWTSSVCDSCSHKTYKCTEI